MGRATIHVEVSIAIVTSGPRSSLALSSRENHPASGESQPVSCPTVRDRGKVNRPLWVLWFSVIAATTACGRPLAAADGISPSQVDFFETKIRPLLIEKCYECHSRESGESAGELLLDSAAAVARGGVHGPALLANKPDRSLLLKAVSYSDPKLQMPPDGKLDAEEIEDLRRWIAMGAPDPRVEASGEPEKAASPIDRDPQTHWAFRSPKRLTGITPSNESSRDAIDAVARVAAEDASLKVNSEASKETLVRRLYFDLTGLPPSQAAIDRFVKSDRPDAYMRLVDSLLAAPAFGERFGRHWMDVSRYADTLGYATAGKTRRHTGSQRFRDWAIKAFATDMPYDEMLRHQLAGDRTDPENKAGNLDAMGFITLGRKFLNPLDTIDDRVDVISRGLLGMTVACARCHDHKFDPIPTADYYSLAGIIFSSDQPKDGASPLMLVDKPNPIDSPILIRGQVGNRGPIAPRQFLTSLRKADEPRFTDGSGRWELAQRITAPDNPLTARVMVNRIWTHLIGKSLVDSPSDFGFRTQPPDVPEVLDELAAEFATHWSVKRIVQRIVMTRIYRQSSAISDEAMSSDPDNGFLARANRRRRDFESLRDGLLCVAGALDRSLGGEPVEITLDTPSPRRSIYAMIDRQNLPALFRTFDFASPDTHSPGRYFTTVPQQSLFLLNNRQIHDLASRTAKAVREDVAVKAATVKDNAAEDVAALAREVFRRVLSREPSEQERNVAAEFLRLPSQKPAETIDSRSMWTYGTATISEDGNSLRDFKPFGVFKDSRWQPGSEFPSGGAMGHAYLGKESGHTPSDLHTAVVRRFTAPIDGRVSIRGTMGHRQKEGDGFVASIWVAGRRIFRGTQKSNNRPYGPLSGQLKKGQTVDLVALPGESSSFDTFYWNARIRLLGSDKRVAQSDSVKHFSGPFNVEAVRPLDRLAQLAQTLMMSNEFAFVD